jgi:GT2 family glycosyltransferase
MTTLTVSIVTANNRDLVLDCLQSIYEHPIRAALSVHVVINDPDDNSEADIRRRYPEVAVTVNEKPMGFTHCHNMVIRNCDSDYVLVLNDDTLIVGQALEIMTSFMDANSEIGILGCKIRYPDGSLQWSCGKSRYHRLRYFIDGMLKSLLPISRVRHFAKKEEVSWVTGACLLVRREAADDVGLFDENIFMYYEDADWCFRMIQRGWKVVFYPNAEIIHYHGQSRKKRLGSNTYVIYENRIYFFSKHYRGSAVGLVKMLTWCEAAWRYVATGLRKSYTADEKRQLRQAYKRVMKLVSPVGLLVPEGGHENRIRR